MKKILLTGAGGFVGARIKQYLGDACVAFPSGMISSAGEEDVRAFVLRHAPDAIIHTAAIADMGVCEKDPDASYRANVLLTEWICRAAKAAGAKAVCFSSDQVYGALSPDKAPYVENMPLAPATVYGRHKLEGEMRGLDILPEAVMLRATWMYDLPGYGLPVRGNLICSLLASALHGRAQTYSANDFRGITYVRQVAELAVRACGLPGGAYNFGSFNDLSMADTAREGLRALGLGDRAEELVTEDRSLPVRRLVMDQTKLNACGLAFDTTAEGLKRCAEDYRVEAFI